MAKKMRGCDMSMTSNTLVIPATAPADTRYAAQSWPMNVSANATGAFRNCVTAVPSATGSTGKSINGRSVLRHRDDSRQDRCDSQIQRRADDERRDDADRQIAAGVLGFLRRRRDGVESDIGEEDHGGSGHDARGAVGSEGLPVLRTYPGRADGDEEQDHQEP